MSPGRLCPGVRDYASVLLEKQPILSFQSKSETVDQSVLGMIYKAQYSDLRRSKKISHIPRAALKTS
jgi:hypothetical protein